MSTSPPPAQPPESVAPVRIGEMLAGKYRVERILGIGGMGVVVAATHVQLDQLVAIKFLLPQALANSEVVERFAREARAAVKITSEHVARVIDVGELPSGAPYMVMEYLNGSDLSQVLAERGPLPCDTAVEYILQASEALAEAHAKGIVHRDLKPANLFLTSRADGTSIIKVLDFGISKGAMDRGSAAEMSLTKTSTMMGSPMYMSPEQMKSSRDVDWRTDIWALGVILYELLSGRPAFNGETVPELLARIMTEDPPPLRSVRPDVPPGLEVVVSRCLAKNANQRIANIAELAYALAPFAPKRGRASAERVHRVMEASGVAPNLLSATAIPPSSAVPGPLAAVGGATAATWSPPTGHGEKSSPRRLAVGIGAAAAVALAGLGIWRFAGGHAAPAGSAAVDTNLASASPPVAEPRPSTAVSIGAEAPRDAVVPVPREDGGSEAASTKPDQGAAAEHGSASAAVSSNVPREGRPTAAPARKTKAGTLHAKTTPWPARTENPSEPTAAALPATTSPPAAPAPTHPQPARTRNPLSIDIK